MRAAVCGAFGQPLVVEDVVLAPPGPGELTVEVVACAVCHSDIIYAEGGTAARRLRARGGRGGGLRLAPRVRRAQAFGSTPPSTGTAIRGYRAPRKPDS
jgi:hypothetical protein